MRSFDQTFTVCILAPVTLRFEGVSTISAICIPHLLQSECLRDQLFCLGQLLLLQWSTWSISCKSFIHFYYLISQLLLT